jgi:hypothetical protein
MSFRIYNKWDEFSYENPRHREQLATALQFFMTLPSQYVPNKFNPKHPECVDKKIGELFLEKRKGYKEAQAQYFTTLSDFPAAPKDVIDKFHGVPLYDNGFESIFDFRDYQGSRRDGFSIVTVTSSLSFRRVKTGEKLEVYEMSGDRNFVYFDYYGGALGWHRSLFDNQDYWTLEDNAIEFQAKSLQAKAAIFYALIEAVAGLKADINWQNPTPAALPNTDAIYEAVRDANTMNFAAQTILLNCAAKYNLTPQTASFVILCPLQLRGRLKRALGLAPSLTGGRVPQIDYNFSLIVTTMLQATDHYWVILPGKQLKAGDRMNLTTFTDFDILSYTDTVAGWMAYGGAVGDTDQLERCNTA